MKSHFRMRKALAVAILAAAGTASAGSYYVVVPIAGKTQLLAGIQVELSSYAMPVGIVGLTYDPFEFNRVLRVTGDPGFNASLVSWTVASGSLPAGLTLSRDGRLSGTPTASGTSSFVLRATYKTRTGEQSYQVAVNNLVVALAQAQLPAGVQGAPYSFDLKPSLSVAGDSAYTGAGVTWSVASGSLPAGLALGADGVITGTPSAENPGTPFTIQASYKTRTGQRAYQVTVGAITVLLSGDSLPGAKHATPYSFDLKTYLAVTGDAAYTAGAGVVWSLASGALPPGITLNSSTGVLSGAPTGSTTPAIFTVQATYKAKTGQRAYSLFVENVQLVLAADAWGPGGSPRAYYYGDQTVATSCKAYRDGKPGYSPATPTGYYWVDMGAGVERVYCDMATNGGGWTLVARSGGPSPAYAGCTVSAGVNTPFGWSVSRGTPADTGNPYSMGVFNRNLAFTEVLFGAASGTSNSWGAYVYQQWVPTNFKTALATNDVSISATKSFGMASRMGHTSDTTQYFFRDMPDGERGPSQGFGLHADGWLSCYGDGPTDRADQAPVGAVNGGYVNFRHGMLMVR
jgi:hypothetical protein